MGTQGATCFHTLSSMHEDIPQPNWDDVRFGMLCTSADNFADIKTAIEKLCSVTKKCTTNMKADVRNFFSNVETFKSKTRISKSVKESNEK